MGKAGLLPASGTVCPDECQVYIRNLPSDFTDLDLYQLMTPFGGIRPKGVKAMLTREGTCNGVGFVDFFDGATANQVVSVLNGFRLPDGSELFLKIKDAKGGKAEDDPNNGTSAGDQK